LNVSITVLTKEAETRKQAERINAEL
jgi:hypothetical protein